MVGLESESERRDAESHLFGGYANVELPMATYDLENGVSLRQTYAHLTSPCLVAFKRPEAAGKLHPPPWKAASGGFAFDITIEVAVPTKTNLPGGFSPKDV